MNINNWKIWNNLSFKTLSYRKNYDLLNTNENIITECEGTISELKEQKPPLIIGEYQLSIWNIQISKILNINPLILLNKHSFEVTYNELINAINYNAIDIQQYDKIVLIQTLIIHPDYRKCEIVEEFIEAIYREYYNKKCAIIALVMPFQDNEIDVDFYLNKRFVQVKEIIGKYTEINNVPAKNYYNLSELLEKKDIEFNEYKLFAIANRCGFNRLNNSHLFIFSPEKIINRLLEKQKIKI